MSPTQIISLIIVLSLLGYIAYSVVERRHFKEKIESLETDNNILKVSNLTLTDHLKEAIALNEQNVKTIKQINKDQEHSLNAIKKLNTDLNNVKLNLEKTRNMINVNPVSVVSPNIVEAIKVIQQMQEDRSLKQ